jgi:hypothetical protein
MERIKYNGHSQSTHIPFWLDLHLPVQPFLSITTKVVSSIPAHSEVHPIQHYVIKFVGDLQEFCGFLKVLRFPTPLKLIATI